MGELKPDGQQVNRTKRQFGWIDLPESGNHSPAPSLPVLEEGQLWSAKTRLLWLELWKTSQSLMWGRDQMPSLERYLILYQYVNAGHMAAATMASMERLESSLGLTPKAMQTLRWRKVPDEQADPRFRPPVKSNGNGSPKPHARPATAPRVQW